MGNSAFFSTSGDPATPQQDDQGSWLLGQEIHSYACGECHWYGKIEGHRFSGTSWTIHPWGNNIIHFTVPTSVGEEYFDTEKLPTGQYCPFAFDLQGEYSGGTIQYSG